MAIRVSKEYMENVHVQGMKRINRILILCYSCLYIIPAILVPIWAIAYLSWPFGWDQGIYAWMGDVIKQGGLPYLDAWDLKGPLTPYIFFGAQAIFGHSMHAIRIFDLLILTAASAMLAVLSSHLTNRKVAGWAVILFVLWFASGNYWNTAQPDGWVSMFMLIGLTPLLVSPGPLRWHKSLLAGICVGLSVLTKPIFILYLFLVLMAVFLQEWPNKTRIFSNSIFVVFGCAILPVILTGWFAYHGALNSMISDSIIYPFKVYSGLNTFSIGSQIQKLASLALSGIGIPLLFPLIGLGLVMLWRNSSKMAIIVGSWFLISLLLVIVQNKFYTYQWAIVYPSVVILCAVGFHTIFFRDPPVELAGKDQRLSPFKLLGAFWLLAILFYAAIHPLFESANWFSMVTNRISREQYYNGFGIPGSDIQAANYIQGRTTEGDPIFVWGWNASIYFLSSRKSSSRYGYSLPLLMGEGTPEYEAYRREVMQDLTLNPPVYLVIAPPADGIVGKNSGLRGFTEFANFVSTRYTEEEKFGDLIIYHLMN